MARRETSLRVVPLAIRYWELLSALFAASPGVNRCWCMWPLHRPGTFHPDSARHRSELKSLLVDGESPGLIALLGRAAVGWCALGPRERYPQYEDTKSGAETWVIPCIYVAPHADRVTVSRALIGTAVRRAQANGAAVLEGPPPWWLPGDESAIALATRTFLENGFMQTAPGARFPTLQRLLG
jgi:GNAT superfamily N-acetyltransferase